MSAFTHGAFLRGMNLGKRRLKNPELVRAAEGAGAANAVAFLASGNLAFEGSGRSSALASQLSNGLEAALGYEVHVFVRSAKRVRALAALAPFGARKGADKRGKLQVAFFRSAKAAKAAEAFASEDDWLVASESELFWLPRGGLSESSLDVNAMMKAHGSFTVRTHRTVVRMATKFF